VPSSRPCLAVCVFCLFATLQDMRLSSFGKVEGETDGFNFVFFPIRSLSPPTKYSASGRVVSTPHERAAEPGSPVYVFSIRSPRPFCRDFLTKYPKSVARTRRFDGLQQRETCQRQLERFRCLRQGISELDSISRRLPVALGNLGSIKPERYSRIPKRGYQRKNRYDPVSARF